MVQPPANNRKREDLTSEHRREVIRYLLLETKEGRGTTKFWFGLWGSRESGAPTRSGTHNGRSNLEKGAKELRRRWHCKLPIVSNEKGPVVDAFCLIQEISERPSEINHVRETHA
jgi:hypothetical protein